METYLGINIDKGRNDIFSEQAIALLKFYCLPNEDPQEAYARAAVAYCNKDLAFAQRIYDYASKGWFMFASPVLSNAPLPNQTPAGLPISCFLTYVADTLESLIEHNTEVSWLSVNGGGVGGHWSSVRAVSDKAPSPIPFLKVVDSTISAYRQGQTRKGSYAAYLDISHPDVLEFMNIRNPTGGDSNRKCFNLYNAVNITDAFMKAVENDDEFELRCPHTNDLRHTTRARSLWQSLLKSRLRTGAPYLNFIDTANRHINPYQKERGLRIHGSNLCNEIFLPTNEERTAVCCLSSVNLEKYDDWKKTDMVGDLVELLDNVLEFFITHAPKELSKAVFSAKKERSIGIGAMGWHGYLQKNNIAWDSLPAKWRNQSIFENIKKSAVERSRWLALERGEPSDLAGSSMRNSYLLAIAPNANSSIIIGCTPSIEPLKANAFTHATRAGSHLVKNKYLEKKLDDLGKNTDDVWHSIITAEGSVQHLNFLSEQDKQVYRTAFEIDQGVVVDHAADRQQYICQGQSVNVFFPAGSHASYVNSVHLRAYKKGLKGLYYLRTSAGYEADKVGTDVMRVALADAEECLSCHG